MKRVYGWVGGRAGVRYVITKFSRMDSLPNFLTHGAPLRSRFARARSSAKIEMSKYAYTTYQKILADLKTSLRGGPFNKQDFLKEVNILDDTIIDFCPLVTKFEKQYGKKFLSTPTTNSN